MHLLDRETRLSDRIIAADPTERVERLKQRYLEIKNRAVIDILRIRTRVMKETEGQARALAQLEEDDKRKSELLKIAEVCDRVPARPARTFYEAIQSVWFVQIMYAWDNEWAWGISPARADQYLYPSRGISLKDGSPGKRHRSCSTAGS